MKNRGTVTIVVTYCCTYSTSRKSRRNRSLQAGWWLRLPYSKLSEKAINGICNHNRKIKERPNENTSSNAIPTRVLRWLQRERSDSGQDALAMWLGGRETVYGFLRDDVREGICDSMGVLYAKYPLRLSPDSPTDSTADCVADDACERHRRW